MLFFFFQNSKLYFILICQKAQQPLKSPKMINISIYTVRDTTKTLVLQYSIYACKIRRHEGKMNAIAVQAFHYPAGSHDAALMRGLTISSACCVCLL